MLFAYLVICRRLVFRVRVGLCLPKEKPKLTCKRRATILRDEREAVAMYESLGYPKQAADEAKHYEFFKKQPCRK